MTNPVSRTPEQVYAEMAAAETSRPLIGDPDWNTRVVEHAERVAGLWRELHAAALAYDAPYWATAAAMYARAHAEAHVKTMRDLLGQTPTPPTEVVEAVVDGEGCPRCGKTPGCGIEWAPEGALCADDMDRPADRSGS